MLGNEGEKPTNETNIEELRSQQKWLRCKRIRNWERNKSKKEF